jgi:FdhD protein
MLYINGTYYGRISFSPILTGEMIIGYLLSEGLVKNTREIEEVKFEDESCRVMTKFGVRPPLPIEKIVSNIKVNANVIFSAVQSLNENAKCYVSTGGVHAAAIYTANGELMACAEDVGRYNVVDKVIGVAVVKNIDLKNCFIVLTGRINFITVNKLARVKIPIVASISAAINSGIEAAQKLQITLIGFVRGQKMNIYTHPERIVM